MIRVILYTYLYMSDYLKTKSKEHKENKSIIPCQNYTFEHLRSISINVFVYDLQLKGLIQ